MLPNRIGGTQQSEGKRSWRGTFEYQVSSGQALRVGCSLCRASEALSHLNGCIRCARSISFINRLKRAGIPPRLAFASCHPDKCSCDVSTDSFSPSPDFNLLLQLGPAVYALFYQTIRFIDTTLVHLRSEIAPRSRSDAFRRLALRHLPRLD